MAQQQYGDRLRDYQMLTDQLAQKYEHDLMERNNRTQYLRQKAETDYSNSNTSREDKIKAGELGAQGTYADTNASDLASVLPNERAAMQSGLQAQQINRTIGEQLSQNQARSQADLKSQQMDAQASRNAFGFLSNLYNAQSRLQGVQDTNSTRQTINDADNKTKKEINTASNTSRETQATTRANAIIKAAEVRAAAAGKRLSGGDVSKLPAGYREAVNSAFRNHAQC